MSVRHDPNSSAGATAVSAPPALMIDGTRCDLGRHRGAHRHAVSSEALLVYDGDCRFCSRCAAFARARLPDTVEVRPWQELDLAEIGLTEVQARSSVRWIDAQDSFAGADAVARALQGMGAPYAVLGRLVAHPLARPTASRLYVLMARARPRGCRTAP